MVFGYFIQWQGDFCENSGRCLQISTCSVFFDQFLQCLFVCLETVGLYYLLCSCKLCQYSQQGIGSCDALYLRFELDIQLCLLDIQNGTISLVALEVHSFANIIDKGFCIGKIVFSYVVSICIFFVIFADKVCSELSGQLDADVRNIIA